LENSPLFNAGKGAVFTNNGTIEHDASIMNGENLNAGASTGTMHVKNPIDLAHSIMTKSSHVFLSGSGAEDFAKSQNLEMVEQEYFYTDFRFNQLEKQKNSVSKFGTVGCVAIDINGNLAAGTSTGGMTNKKWGRIGDSPIIGAGTYANNKTCAISCTGSGEYFMRSVVAYDISALMEYKDLSLKEAVFKVIHKKLPSIGGDGGLIAIDNKGNIIMDFNTPGMYRASINKYGEKNIAIYVE
jgi:beta-aspartyl-peptidase (threonine type)